VQTSDQAMLNYLRIRFLDDKDGSGKLLVRAQVDGFSGESGAYFNVDDLEAFAESLMVFPLPAYDSRRAISGGFGTLPGRDEMPQEHVGISVYLADRQRGYIGIQVRMATEVWPQTRPESKKQASVEILVTYEPLAKFGRDLLSVVRGSLDEAVVPGETSL
jgi:hypothetical protein